MKYNIAGSEKNRLMVLLPGANNTPEIYRGLIDTLSQNYLVITPYYPGFGDSPPPEKHTYEYYLEKIEFMIDEVLDRFEKDSAILFGVSFGSALSLDLNKRLPTKKISHLILASPLLKVRSFFPPFLLFRFWQQDIYRLVSSFVWGIEDSMPFNFSLAYTHNIKEQIRHSLMIMNRSVAKYASSYYTIEKPTLAIIGKQDTVIDIDFTLESLNLHPEVELYYSQRMGHNVASQLGDELNQVLDEFFENEAEAS
jgi:pimeloyl-ACP methyl ester carboxylesterase